MSDLTIYEEVKPPAEVLALAVEVAKALKSVISKKTKPLIFNNEQYLEFEDWQTVGQFYGYAAKTGDAVPIEIHGVRGFKATAYLVNFRNGEIIGSADGYCMKDEPKWDKRAKYEWIDKVRTQVGEEDVPWFQLASMAQTRAAAKALRNRLAWVVVLAGYRPTPAEELPDSGEQKKTEATAGGHWCKEHGIAFFKRGKMKAYGHPIYGEDGKETGEWCHEHTEPVNGKAVQKEPPANLGELIFANKGEFYMACLQHLKLNKTQVDEAVSVFNLDVPEQRGQAWLELLGRQNGAAA